jgi:hypothetical protein
MQKSVTAIADSLLQLNAELLQRSFSKGRRPKVAPLDELKYL